MTSMQIGFFLTTVVVASLRTVYCGEHPDGISEVSRAQDALGNYHFSYSVANSEGDQFRKEGTDALGRVVGSYGLTHNDGTHRVVDYVADQHGFRAEVRSNEAGVISAEAADASIIRTDHPSPPLSVAATNNDDARESFGKRLSSGSRVAYVVPSEKETKVPDHLDEGAKESRQTNFDDYRPLSPVAYYPGDVSGPGATRLRPPVQRPVDVPRSSRVLTHSPTVERRPLDAYFPPIDPHHAIRRPATYVPRERESDRNLYSTTTSRKPFIPPYGGFDDDPLPGPRRPSISMTTIHGGGLGSRRHLPSPAPTPVYGAGRYPSADGPVQRDFDLPRFPPLSSGFPSSLPHQPGGVLPSFPQGLPNTPLFNPPSYEGGIGSPNFVLRAVPIPNGIQAVRVDPNTGRVYERLIYPLYLRHDGHPAYDRNILLHNDDVSDDGATRNNDDSSYFDIEFPSRAAYRGARDRPFDENDNRNVVRQNVSYVIDESSLSKPTADDMAWVRQQLASVEGFERDRFSDGYLPNSLSYQDSEFLSGDQFEGNRGRFGPSSELRMRHTPGLWDYTNRDGFPRNPRNSDSLTSEDSEEKPSKFLEESASNVEESKDSVSQIEEEGV